MESHYYLLFGYPIDKSCSLICLPICKENDSILKRVLLLIDVVVVTKNFNLEARLSIDMAGDACPFAVGSWTQLSVGPMKP